MPLFALHPDNWIRTPLTDDGRKAELQRVEKAERELRILEMRRRVDEGRPLWDEANEQRPLSEGAA